MWLYVPSHCLQESEDSTSEFDLLFLRLERFATWKGSFMPPQFWRRAWKKEAWTSLLSTATLKHSTLAHGVERWILFMVGSHASPTPSPASGKATKTNAPSGQNLQESWPSVDPPWSSSRTSQPSLWGEDLDLSERNYADWATSSKIRSSSARQMLARLTFVRGSSSSPTIWQTPKDSSGGNVSRSGDRKDELLLAGQAETWPTAVVQDSESHAVAANRGSDSSRHSGTTLTDATRDFEERGRRGENQYPTPSATVYGSGQNEGTIEHVRPSRGTPSLSQWASSPQAQKISMSGSKSSKSPRGSRRRLNPAFVCWLMGWPWWWTRTEHINSVAPVTELYPPRQDGHS